MGHIPLAYCQRPVRGLVRNSNRTTPQAEPVVSEGPDFEEADEPDPEPEVVAEGPDLEEADEPAPEPEPESEKTVPPEEGGESLADLLRVEEPEKEAPVHLLEGSISALREAVDGGSCDAHLNALLHAEKEGKNRKTAVALIEARIERIK